ncbi:G patch domain and ankyrin repeat-containing protein 1 [Pelobates fuscus]|uniref:G patch domain and ankyrin repeat-containing protein 1 n=1 Tax=Pelobates fuscus TaxID=191477 RepID=UPI002FE432AC
MNHPRLITFTRAREKSDFWENGERSRKKSFGVLECSTSGAEARNFYESLISSEGKTSTSRRLTRKRKIAIPSSNRESLVTSSQDGPTRTVPTERAISFGHQLLKCSQEGDLKGVQKLVEKEKCDINFSDNFFWTALMCAAYGGRKDVVNYLLKNGAAWVGVCDTQGKDALILAEESGHGDIVQLLQHSLSGLYQETAPRRRSMEKKYCELCKTHYQEDTIETHERSTVHLFNKRKKLPPTYYAIPENNVGFKMMLKEGWNRESGLGPSGTGRKFPVQTVLKRDQKGLGFQTNQKAKVTHFPANDTLAVSRPETKPSRIERVSTVSKKEERRKEEREKTWERNLRTYMNIDI